MGFTPKEDRALPPFRRAAADMQEQNIVTDIQPEDNFSFYGLRHNPETLLGFRILFASGKISVIYYHDLISPLDYDGAGTIEINTPHITVKITGRNLFELFQAIADNRAAWIKEPDSSFVSDIGRQPEIETIRIKERD